MKKIILENREGKLLGVVNLKKQKGKTAYFYDGDIFLFKLNLSETFILGHNDCEYAAIKIDIDMVKDFPPTPFIESLIIETNGEFDVTYQ